MNLNMVLQTKMEIQLAKPVDKVVKEVKTLKDNENALSDEVENEDSDGLVKKTKFAKEKIVAEDADGVVLKRCWLRKFAI